MSAKCWPLCSGLNVLTDWGLNKYGLSWQMMNSNAKYSPVGPADKPALFHAMIWCWAYYKPMSKAMLWTSDTINRSALMWEGEPANNKEINRTSASYLLYNLLNSSPPRQNGRCFSADIFRCNFMNEKFCILIEISLKVVPKGRIDNKSTLVYIMAWRRIGDKPLTEPMLTRFTDVNMQY